MRKKEQTQTTTKTGVVTVIRVAARLSGNFPEN